MKSRIVQHLVTLLLALIAAASGFLFYISISLGHMMGNVLRGIGLRVGTAKIPWDNWLLLALSVLSVLAMLGQLQRSDWARTVSLIVLGASFAWAFALTALPEAQLENWFSTRIDRWAAAPAGAAMLAGFAFVWSHAAGSELRRIRTLE